MLSMSVFIFFNSSVSDADAIYKRKIKFLSRLQSSENILCKLFAKNITDELATVHYYLCRPSV